MRIELEHRGERTAWEVDPTACDWKAAVRRVDDASVEVASSRLAYGIARQSKGPGSEKLQDVMLKHLGDAVAKANMDKDHLHSLLAEHGERVSWRLAEDEAAA